MTKTNLPLVSVVCLCYNHSKYVIQAIDSVLTQSYNHIELIVVDDASTDDSQAVIQNHLSKFPQINFIPLSKNLGNCAAFNIGWKASSGKYIIDLAADDFLLPERIAIGVDALEIAGDHYGVHFTDARIIDKSGTIVSEHLTSNYFQKDVPQGYVYISLLEQYFINPVTMMYSNEMLDFLGGYDESLAYEDFDLWVRSSKKFKYCYSKEILVVKRNLKRSKSHKQYTMGSKILRSTFQVCVKAFELCDNDQEYYALITRIRYEMKMALISFNWIIVWKLYKLRQQTLAKITVTKF